MMRILSAVIIACSVTKAASAQSVYSGMRAYQTFNDWCLGVPPNFETISASAKTKGIKPSQHQNSKDQDGAIKEESRWIVDNKEGTFGVSAVKVVRPDTVTNGCAIYFPTGVDADVLPFLIKRFGDPEQSNNNMVSWKGPFPTSEITLMYRKLGQTYIDAGLLIRQTEPLH